MLRGKEKFVPFSAQAKKRTPQMLCFSKTV